MMELVDGETSKQIFKIAMEQQRRTINDDGIKDNLLF